MTKITCTACQAPLTGGTDTFGEVQLPMCQQCFLELGEEPLEAKTIKVLELGKAPQYPSGGWFPVTQSKQR